MTEYTVEERDRSVAVIVALMADTEIPQLTFSLMTEDGTATGNKAQYTHCNRNTELYISANNY